MKTIFLFPGQGAHVSKISVLKEYDSSLYSEEMKIISDAYGFDVMDFVCSADSATLSQVKYTQLVMFAANAAFYHIAVRNGLVPDITAGHSIGQFSALYAAGCFDLHEIAVLIKQRAELMSQVTVSGKLCAVKAPFSIDPDKIREICRSITEGTERILDIALLNSDKQIVIGGEESAVSEFINYTETEKPGFSAALLPVGQAFHTKLMESMLEPFGECIDRITVRKPQIPVILNTTGTFYSNDDLKNEMLSHCVKPVQWEKTIRELLKTEDARIYEAGPGHTLSGFFRNMSKTKVIVMEDRKTFLRSL